jgi:RNA polymerase sigma factor (sigma-70 family)
MTEIQFNNALLGMRDKLWYYALNLTSHRENAEDLLQDTFLKALTHRDKFIHNTDFKAWTYRIMQHTYINSYRRNIRTKKIFDKSNDDFHLLFLKDNLYPSPDLILSLKETLNCIQSFEDEYKVPFTMFLSGYKYKEIAEHLKLNPGTLKSRIFFARKKLEKALAI